MPLPKGVRMYILNYVGETNNQEKLRELPLISKQFYKDCKEFGLEWKLHPLFVLSAKDNKEDEGRTLNFIHTMNQYQHDKNTYRKLQRYDIFKVENLEQFHHAVPNSEITEWVTKKKNKNGGDSIIEYVFASINNNGSDGSLTPKSSGAYHAKLI